MKRQKKLGMAWAPGSAYRYKFTGINLIILRGEKSNVSGIEATLKNSKYTAQTKTKTLLNIVNCKPGLG